MDRFIFYFLAMAMLLKAMGCGHERIEKKIDGGMMDDDYPAGPYGYKPAVREKNGSAYVDKGDTLPDICLQTWDGSMVCSEDIFRQKIDLYIVLMSIRDCVPCYEAYHGLSDLQIFFWTKGFRTAAVTIIGDADLAFISDLAEIYPQTFLADPDHAIVGDWESDCWPEQVRGFPSLLFIDGSNMRILADTLGFENSQRWFNDQLNKIKLGVSK